MTTPWNQASSAELTALVGRIGRVQRISLTAERRDALRLSAGDETAADTSLADFCPDPLVLALESGLPRPAQLGVTIDGGSEWEQLSPLSPGILTAISRIAEVAERTVSTGRQMTRTCYETRLHDERGVQVGTVRGFSLDLEPADPASPTADPNADAPSAGASVTAAPADDRALNAFAITPHGRVPQAGERLPELGPITVSYQDAVRWAAASGDFTSFHFDPSAAAAKGFRGPVAHGPWKSAVLRCLVSRWLGDAALRSFSTNYLHADLVGEQLTFGGEVVELEHADDGTLRVHLDVWVTGANGDRSVSGTCVAVVQEQQGGLPLERLRRAVRLGDIAGVFTYEVTANDIAGFVEAVTGEKREFVQGDAAPAIYFGALDPVERRDIDLDAFLQDLPFRKTGGGNAFNEIAYVRPIRVGDVVKVTTRYTEVYEKTGSRGTLLFRVRENELIDVSGDPIGTSRCGHVLAFDIDSETEGRA
ncbi:MaoC family dehydratase N-terminal domain-containing protein [Microbacterium sp. Bi121]|uniref:FAS1-like dehydratase domain-containing protein n=1 Tax=Microbacterium sp. Bi121 TaxID=2822348 RepID=UPI001D694297|nr:MaoC family dehydratase N-terminal domain-containing protein [Microbacterium sp. Bi121]CAH0123208.1 hypothetical protein SRABI121_00387 [Microbacterium sp. Bi121]